MRATQDLARLQYSHRMLDAVVDEIDGRDIRVGGQWLTDYASANYLGFDVDEEIIDAIPEYLARWGTYPSWSRLLGNPVLLEEIEDRVTELLGTEDSLVLPTITHIHISVIPVLVGSGTLFVDQRAHRAIDEGCAVAQSRGSALRRFAHEDLDQLESSLRAGDWRRPGMILTDSLDGMTGNACDLRALAALAREFDVLLYVNDTEGFGVLGQRDGAELCAYGRRGNGTVRHLGERYENVILVGGFSRAYSSPLAVVACPTSLKQLLKTAAPPYLYSAPSSIASLAGVLEGLRVNEQRGDQLRARLSQVTDRVLDRVQKLGIHTPNRSGFPIIALALANPADVDAVGETLFERGLYVTMAVPPLVAPDEVGFRLALTCANTDYQVDYLIDVLTELAAQFKLREATAD
jgi:8-amino-7-oxononanoate synthase